jgi:23S rRNA A1618 N6-methylase RlmF
MNIADDGDGPSKKKQRKENDQIGEGRVEETSALEGNLKTIKMKPNQSEKQDLMFCLERKKTSVLKILEKQLKEKKGVKWFVSVQVKMVKLTPDNEEKVAFPHFRSRCFTSLGVDELDRQYDEAVGKIKESFLEYQREGTGWQLEEVSKTDFFYFFLDECC